MNSGNNIAGERGLDRYIWRKVLETQFSSELSISTCLKIQLKPFFIGTSIIFVIVGFTKKSTEITV